MGVYTEADDIRQHMRGATALPVETIEELMEEQEYYVQTTLKLSELPPGNPILASIIRDLTVSASIYALTSPTIDDLAKADNLRGIALRKLREVDNDIGLGILGGEIDLNPEAEITAPEPVFFHLLDFDPYRQLRGYDDTIDRYREGY